MKRITLLLFFLPAILISQNVYTIATATGINDEMTFDLEGNLLGSHFQGSAITKLDLSTGMTNIFSDGYNTPNGLAVDDEGNAYLADNFDNKIYKISPEGESELFVELESPGGLLFISGTDTLVATSFLGNKIFKVSPNGDVIEWASEDMLDGPVGICADDDGHIYVGNFYGRKIIKISSDGSQNLLAEGPTSGWLGSIEYTGGYIYGTLINTHKIFKTDLMGNTEVILGSTAGNADGGSSEATFNAPGGIIASPHGDTLYVSETTTHNIRMITDLEGEPSNDLEIIQSSSFRLYPNPFQDKIKIEFELNAPASITVFIHDVNGGIIKSIYECEELRSGVYQADLDTPQFKSELYFITLSTCGGEILSHRKVIRMN